MSAQFETSGAGELPAPDGCPLCDGAVSADAERCGACGYHLAGVGDRPGPFDRVALAWTVAGFAIVYVIATLVVLAAR